MLFRSDHVHVYFFCQLFMLKLLMKLEVLLDNYLNTNKIAFSVNEKFKYSVVVFFGVGLVFIFL